MSVSTPIHDFLVRYTEHNPLRCHMPGHNGHIPHDITEICGADSLYEANGIIAQSEETATSLFQTGRTYYSCAGSTLGIQTMLALVKQEGKNRISAGRYSHRSLVSAAVLLGLEIDWLMPKEFLLAEISAAEAEASITPETAAVFINSLDYYGGACDISAVAAVCEKHRIPLLVDNAHGAYRVFTGGHPIHLGAFMCCDSAHKTLPALTGTAYLHLSAEAVSRYGERAKEMMRLFGSSSPSYLMLESLDLLNRHIHEDKQRVIGVLEAIRVLKSRLTQMGIPLRKSDDLRITVIASEMGYPGTKLEAVLASKGIQAEMADENHVVLLFSTITTGEDLAKVETVFSHIPIKPAIQTENINPQKPQKLMSIRKAFFSKGKRVALLEAEGMVCGELVAPCPPGVPLLMPGEKLSKEGLLLLQKYGVSSLRVVTE